MGHPARTLFAALFVAIAPLGVQPSFAAGQAAAAASGQPDNSFKRQLREDAKKLRLPETAAAQSIPSWTRNALLKCHIRLGPGAGGNSEPSDGEFFYYYDSQADLLKIIANSGFVGKFHAYGQGALGRNLGNGAFLRNYPETKFNYSTTKENFVTFVSDSQSDSFPDEGGAELIQIVELNKSNLRVRLEELATYKNPKIGTGSGNCAAVPLPWPPWILGITP